MAVPNQKIITVRKEPKPEKGYTYFTWKALDTARAKLKPGAFMLWTYIAQNKDGYEFGLSNADFCGETTMGRDAYNTAVKELIDKRYLVLRSGKTVYDFYELPLQENPITENKESAVADKSDNQKQENPITVVGKSDNQKQENPTRNIIEYDNNTINDTSDFSAEGGIRACQEEPPTSIPADLPLFYLLFPGANLQDLIEMGMAVKVAENTYEVTNKHGEKTLVKER